MTDLSRRAGALSGLAAHPHTLTGPLYEHATTLTGCRDARTDPLAQQIPLKLHQRRHQEYDQFAP